MFPRPSQRAVAGAAATLAAMATAAAFGATGSVASAAPPHPSYPTPQQAVPKQVHFLSSEQDAPGPSVGDGYVQFTPEGIQKSYRLPALHAAGIDGSGKTIAIIDSFGYPQAAADLKAFSDAYGLPEMCGMPAVGCKPGMATFKTLTFGDHQVTQSPPSHSPGQEDSNAWSVEVALDIEYAHTVAPGANILLVATPTAETLGVQGFPNMMNAEQYVVDHHLANVVSQSFGAAEDSFGSQQSLKNLRQAFISGTQQGMTFLASSGDFGSLGFSKQPVGKGGSQLDSPQVGWPSSDPLVTAVGGTNLCTDPSTGQTLVQSATQKLGPASCQDNPGMRETGWSGSGGGFSHVFARPGYQDALPAGSTSIPAAARGVPDISMDASCSTYVVVRDTAPGYHGYYGVCGTSAASPMFSGVVAMADQVAGHDLGQINDRLYAMANGSGADQVIYDVTAGDNTQQDSDVEGYPAGPGWDAVTGLGSPADAPAFVAALAGQ